MIIREREHWFSMLWIWQGSILPKILPQLLLLLAFSLLIFLGNGYLLKYRIPLNPTAFSLLGIALAIFLGFLNSASYDRFWEGRKLWGALLIDSRSLTRQVITLCDAAPAEERTLFLHRITAFAYALKHQLRKTDAQADLRRLLPEAEAGAMKQKRFITMLLLNEMGKDIRRWQSKGYIDTITMMGLDESLNKLSGIAGGCERIANTPVPFTYHVLLHRTIYIYCFLLPFGLVDSIGWMMPVLATFIGYTFIALDAITAEIGEPFGTEPNDLALNAICHTIEYSVYEQSGIAEPVMPVQHGYFVD